MRKSFPSFAARTLVAAAALACVPFAARAVEVPATAVTEDTVLVAYLDVSAVNSKDIAEELAKFQANLVKSNQVDAKQNAKQKEQADKIIKGLLAAREKFVTAGGEGLLFGIAQPAKDGDKPEPYVLIKSKAGADRAKLEAVIHGLSDLAKDQAQAATAILSTKVEKYGSSTTWHALTGDELAAPPQNGTAKDAAVFNGAFKSAGKGTLEMCFRLSGKMKTALKAQIDAQAQNPDQNDMMTAMLGGIMQPLVNLDTVTLVGTGTKGSRKVETLAHFSDSKSAKEFTGAANGLIEMGKGMFGMQLAQMGKYGVDTKNAQDMLAAFVLKDVGNDAALKLDDAFFTKAEKFGEQMQAAQQKMQADMKSRRGGAPVDADEEDAKALDAAETK